MIGGYHSSVGRPRAETWSARYELTADQVVDTAVSLVARHGFKGVSMTRIAEELGVTTPALYHHFADKRELLDRAADRIVSLIEQPPASAPWTERLRALILDQERVFRRYPGTYRYLIDNPAAPARLRFMDIAAGSVLGQFPHVEKHIDLLLGMPYDEYFRLGLDELISALAAGRREPAPRTAGPKKAR